MKFHCVNPRNIKHIVPSWAIDPYHFARYIDGLLYEYFGNRLPDWDAQLKFWIDAKFNGDGWAVRIAEPDEKDPLNFCGQLCLDHPDWTIFLSLNEMLKGSPSIEGTYSLYIHTFYSETPISYIGLTKQTWFKRLSQHEYSARNGSPYLFHRNIREMSGHKISHRVLLTMLDYETAMELEEAWIEEFSLYPKGLNMIPGGFAGLRYLHTLGIAAKTIESRDEAVESLAARDTIEGRPNPLCAARWLSDQDYINRVICGHSGRLTVDQVRSIRMMSLGGANNEHIAKLMGDTVARVRRVASGKRYGKVA